MHLFVLPLVYLAMFINFIFVSAHPWIKGTLEDTLGRRQAPSYTVSGDDFTDCLDPNNTPKGQVSGPFTSFQIPGLTAWSW